MPKVESRVDSSLNLLGAKNTLDRRELHGAAVAVLCIRRPFVSVQRGLCVQLRDQERVIHTHYRYTW